MTDLIQELPNQGMQASLKALVDDIERSADLKQLELHFRRASSYLRALRDVAAVPEEQLQLLKLLFEQLYRDEFRRLGHSGHLGDWRSY